MPNYKLSILIPSLMKRKAMLSQLMDVLRPQSSQDVQFVTFIDEGQKSTGTKRNWLLDRAEGEYLAFVDDDDMVSEKYIPLLMEGIEKKVDCCSLVGQMTTDGRYPATFIHSLKYKRWFEDSRPTSQAAYYRPPNHLNCIRSDVAKRFRFPDQNHSEDKDWSMQIQRSGLLKIEHEIKEIIYYYRYISRK